MSILAIGTVAFDAIETPFGKVDRILGGSATYITLAARYFTNELRLSAVVGSDFPQSDIDLFHQNGINTDGLIIDPTGKTFFWSGKYHMDLNNRDTLQTDLNVLATFDPKLPESYLNSEIVCLGNLDPSIQLNVLNQLHQPELVVLDTMNYWIERTPDKLRAVLERADVLIINDAEARQLANVPNLIKAARIIRAMGPKYLVIKKGEHGALLFGEEAIFSAPALPIEDVVDPTGAGDSFAGGFVGYLASVRSYDFESLKLAVIYGSTMASFNVEAFGPDRLLHLTRSEILHRADRFRMLGAIPEEVYEAI
ncbi:MAG: sugar kinase [Bacteroidetes Order II. Incertae sedis bacterium]|nr:sugar kinase [Bacteroidetes Order II. bacterium]